MDKVYTAPIETLETMGAQATMRLITSCARLHAMGEKPEHDQRNLQTCLESWKEMLGIQAYLSKHVYVIQELRYLFQRIADLIMEEMLAGEISNDVHLFNLDQNMYKFQQVATLQVRIFVAFKWGYVAPEMENQKPTQRLLAQAYTLRISSGTIAQCRAFIHQLNEAQRQINRKQFTG